MEEIKTNIQNSKVDKWMICMIIEFFFYFSIFQFIVKSIYQPTAEDDQQKDSDQVSYENWSTFFQKAAIIQHCMCYFNSAINPIIYYFMSAQFKVIIFAQFKVCNCLQIQSNTKGQLISE